VSISSLLTHCPGCESSLIQVESLEAEQGGKTLVARRCPECGHADGLELPGAVADLLEQRAVELSACILELADRLEIADELWIYEQGPSR
jgi:hypothetical protein